LRRHQSSIVAMRLEPATEMMCADAGLHADQASRHIGKPASTWPHDHFCRSTMAPRSSSPTTWNEFLPISTPITVIALLGFSDMACSLSLAPLARFAGG